MLLSASWSGAHYLEFSGAEHVASFFARFSNMAEEEVIEIDMVQLKKMKVQELRKQAAELGLETKGTKAEILSRIEKYLKEQDEELLEEEEEDEREEGEEVGEEEEEEEKPTDEKEVPQAPKSITPPPSETKAAEVTAVQPATAAAKVSLAGGGELSEDEKIAKRAERFGTNSGEEAKKLARAQRFGTSLENGLGSRPPPTEEELKKMQKRAERFGMNVAPSLTQVEDNEKKQKRRERFGLATTDLGMEERKKARLERFGQST